MSFDDTRKASRPSPSPDAAPATGTLKIIRGPDSQLVGTTYPLRGATVQLGRVRCSADSITLNDPDVSRQHAFMTHSSDGHRLADLNSTNGTMVNGQALDAEVLLRTGDTILIGSTVLVYTRT